MHVRSRTRGRSAWDSAFVVICTHYCTRRKIAATARRRFLRKWTTEIRPLPHPTRVAGASRWLVTDLSGAQRRRCGRLPRARRDVVHVDAPHVANGMPRHPIPLQVPARLAVRTKMQGRGSDQVSYLTSWGGPRRSPISSGSWHSVHANDDSPWLSVIILDLNRRRRTHIICFESFKYMSLAPGEPA